MVEANSGTVHGASAQHFLEPQAEPCPPPLPANVALCVMQLEGSSLVESINNKFTATMTNSVRWREADGGAGGDGGSSSTRSASITSGRALPADHTSSWSCAATYHFRALHMRAAFWAVQRVLIAMPDLELVHEHVELRPCMTRTRPQCMRGIYPFMQP